MADNLVKKSVSATIEDLKTASELFNNDIATTFAKVLCAAVIRAGVEDKSEEECDRFISNIQRNFTDTLLYITTPEHDPGTIAEIIDNIDSLISGRMVPCLATHTFVRYSIGTGAIIDDKIAEAIQEELKTAIAGLDL